MRKLVGWTWQIVASALRLLNFIKHPADLAYAIEAEARKLAQGQ